MHFRERGMGVQLVRSVYDRETKRQKQEVVGRFRRNAPTLPDDLVAKLTKEEQVELTAYLERVNKLENLRRKLAAHSLLRSVTEAIEYMKISEDDSERDVLRQDFAEAIKLLRRSFAGHETANEKPTP